MKRPAGGKWLVTGRYYKTARLWDLASACLWELATGKKIRTYRGHSDWVNSVCLSADNKWLVTGSYDNTARIWEVATGKQGVLRGHVGGITSVALSADVEKGQEC